MDMQNDFSGTFNGPVTVIKGGNDVIATVGNNNRVISSTLDQDIDYLLNSEKLVDVKPDLLTVKELLAQKNENGAIVFLKKIAKEIAPVLVQGTSFILINFMKTHNIWPL